MYTILKFGVGKIMFSKKSPIDSFHVTSHRYTNCFFVLFFWEVI